MNRKGNILTTILMLRQFYTISLVADVVCSEDSTLRYHGKEVRE